MDPALFGSGVAKFRSYPMVLGVRAFLRERKKWWLLPVIVMLALVGALLIFAQGSALAPFIYTIF